MPGRISFFLFVFLPSSLLPSFLLPFYLHPFFPSFIPRFFSSCLPASLLPSLSQMLIDNQPCVITTLGIRVIAVNKTKSLSFWSFQSFKLCFAKWCIWQMMRAMTNLKLSFFVLTTSRDILKLPKLRKGKRFTYRYLTYWQIVNPKNKNNAKEEKQSDILEGILRKIPSVCHLSAHLNEIRKQGKPSGLWTKVFSLMFKNARYVALEPEACVWICSPGTFKSLVYSGSQFLHE